MESVVRQRVRQQPDHAKTSGSVCSTPGQSRPRPGQRHTPHIPDEPSRLFADLRGSGLIAVEMVGWRVGSWR